MAHIGNAPFGKTVRTVTSETLTSVKTAYYPTGGYIVGYVDVYVNGVRLTETADFTATDGTTVTLQYNPSIGDTVDVVTYGSIELANAVRRDGDTLVGTLYTRALVPTANITYDIGTSTMRYKDLYLSGNTINLGDIQLTANSTSFRVSNTTGGTFPSSLANTTITGTLTANATTITGNVSVTGNTTLTGTLTVNSTVSTVSNSLFIDSALSNTFTFLSSNNNNNNVFGNNQTGYTNLILKTDTGTAQIWRGGSTYTNYAGNSGLSIYTSNSTGGHIALFPGGDGTAAIFAYANGNVTFPRQPMFSKTPNNNNYITTNPIPFNSNTQYGHSTSHYNDSTYRFTAPISGRYLFLLTVYCRVDPATNPYFYPRFRYNGATSAYAYWNNSGTVSNRVDQTVHLTRFYSMSAGDYVDVAWNGSASTSYYAGAYETFFEGYLVG
jgi:hypothetical protein